ncbi:hypothetical protein CPB86DRAFT_791301 [Serendipita vermifera]|nr:hypothetical protein CPB86DRAFT_791301 [Serendipita vermifera]
MSESTSINKLIADLPPLDQDTFEAWSWETRNVLMTDNIWNTILNKNTSGARPTRPVPADTNAPTAAETENINKFDKAAEKAARWLLQAARMSHRELTEPHLNPPDAPKMWDNIQGCYARQDAGVRFHALTKLLNCRKNEDDNWEQYIHQINTECHALTRLIPDGWTQLNFLDEVKMFVLLNELPKEHPLHSTLLVDPNLSYTSATNAVRRYVVSTNLPSEVAAAAHNTSNLECYFCQNKGHGVVECHNMRRYQEMYFNDRANRGRSNRGGRGGRGRGRGHAHSGGYSNRQNQTERAQAADGADGPVTEDNPPSEEFAGNVPPAT